MVKSKKIYDSDDELSDDIYVESSSLKLSAEEGEISEDSFQLDDGYDANLMGDDEDIEMLNKMTEVEREKELFKRMERREALKARKLIEKRLKASKRNISKVKIEENRPKRSNISLTTNKKNDSISKLKEQRLKYKMKEDNNDEEFEINKNKFDKIKTKFEDIETNEERKIRYLNGNFEENSDEEFGDTYQKKSLIEISTLDEFNKLRISRHKLTLRGIDERVIRMEYISNQCFVESEFQSYCNILKEVEKPLPTIENVEQKQQDLNFCINFRPTEKDIDHVVQQKNKFRKTPVNYTVEKSRELAKQEGNIELANKLEAELKRLDIELEKLGGQRNKNLDKIRLINEKNRRVNAAQLEKALETNHNNNDDDLHDVNNPFVRRQTNPINILDKRNFTHTTTKKNIQSNNKKSTDINSFDISKDLENVYNFDIDISLDLPINTNSYKISKNFDSKR